MTEKVKILNHLQSREDEMVELLETFVNIDSPSTDKASVDRFARLVAAKWQSLGADVTIPVSYTHLDVYKRQSFNSTVRYLRSLKSNTLSLL